MTDTHMRDVAIFRITETRIDCDGSCAVPGGPRPTNLEWSGLPPSLLSLVERAFREGLPPEQFPGVQERREVRIGLGPLQVRIRRR